MFVRTVVAFPLLLAIGAAQVCTVQATGTPALRANGVTEATSEVLISCAGGKPVQAPHVIPATDVTLRFNVPVTSKIIAPGATDALMFFNDPAPAGQFPCTIGACTNHAGIPFGPNISDNKNVFAARTGINNREIIFVDVPVDYKADGTTTLRITNLRVDASSLGIVGGAQGSVEVSITSTISGTDGSFYPLANPSAVIGTATSSYTASPLDGTTLIFSTASALNEPLSPSSTLTARYRFRELLAAAFRRRSASSDPLTTLPQNLPGTAYPGESGFYNPAFPTAENLNVAGLANNGTRLMLQFVNVPSGVSIYAPVRLDLTGGGSAQLVNTDANGIGGFSPASAINSIANGVQVAQLTVTNGTALAAWEVTATNQTTIEDAVAGFVVSHPAGLAVGGTMRVIPIIGPLAVAQSQVAPRFITPAVPEQTSLHFSNSLSVVGAPLATAARGRSYNQTVQPARGFPPYIWEVSGGQFPPGLFLQNNGTINGTPLTAGSYQFTLRVTDGTGASADSQPMSLTVVNPPAFSALPAGTVDQPYILAAPVTASTSVNLIFESGTLPPGVAYNASTRFFEGFPAQPGNFPIRMRAVDAYGFETIADLILAVTAPTGRPLLSAPEASAVLPIAGTTVSWTAVPGAAVYEVRVIGRSSQTPQADPNGPVVFFLVLHGQNSTQTFASLPVPLLSSNLYTFEAQVRSCTSAARTNCTPFSRRQFSSNPPVLTAIPAKTQQVSGSLVTLSWAAVANATRYQVEVSNQQQPVYRIALGAGETATIASLPSGNYDWWVSPCSVRCNPVRPSSQFTIGLPPVPVSAPGNPVAQVTGPNTMTASWQAVANADIYEMQLVQPGAGPGGGALTVASVRTNALTTNLSVPSGLATAFIRACNGDGCGPYTQVTGLNVPGPNPAIPVVSSPLAGQNVTGPVVFFAWSRIPGDNGSNTTYRLYVQDQSRQAAALDVLTSNNFYAAYLQAEGTRYDALVIARPGTPQQAQSGAVGFNVQGTSAIAPTLTSPTHLSRLPQGQIQIGWTPVPNAQTYEFYVEAAGLPPIRGVSSALSAQIPLTPAGGVMTRYNGIVRACPAGAICLPEQDSGWSPWSDQAGGGVTSFDIIP